jgi:NitT/TauT family transport system permease protein
MTAIDQEQEPVMSPPEAASADEAVAAEVVDGPASTEPAASDVTPTGRTRGTRHSPLLRIRGDLDGRLRTVLGVAGVVVILGAWWIASSRIEQRGAILPTPPATWSAFVELWSDGTLTSALWASMVRIFVGYSISVLIGMVVGMFIGSYRSVEAFFEPQVGFLRYIPASALTPLFLLALGIGESPKIWLIVIGTVFFNIVMMADVARSVPRELLDAAYTLGAGRWTVMRRVILRHSVPGIIDTARVNLAAAWLMLVVAELLAAQEGLAYQIIIAQRFRATDSMWAILIVFGVIGLLSDLGLRGLRNVAAPWNRP